MDLDFADSNDAYSKDEPLARRGDH